MAIYCPSCGRSIPDDAKICPYCGKTIPLDAKPFIVPAKPRKDDSKKILIIVLVVMFLLIGSIAIAGTVYVFVSGNISPSENYYSTPNIIFTKSETEDRLTVVHADNSADWSRISIHLASEPYYPVHFARYELSNVSASLMGQEIPVGSNEVVYISDYEDLVIPGDFLDFGAEGGQVNDVTIVIVDVTSDTVISEFTFLTIDSIQHNKLVKVTKK